MTHPHIVSREEWLVARQALLLKEKEAWDPLESTCRHASLSIL